MKNSKFLYIAICLFCFSKMEGQSWVWVNQSKNIGNTSDLDVTYITTDRAGNIYETGIYQDSIKFGVDTIVTQTNTPAAWAYLVKYDSNGNLKWIRNATASTNNGNIISMSIATDKVNNIYMTGYFYDSVAFGSKILIGDVSNANSFVVKYDSAGNVLWATSSNISSSSDEQSYSIAVDDSGNAYITGYFYGKIILGSDTLINHNGYENPFISKYSASGNELWLKAPTEKGSTIFDTYGYSVATDHLGNVFVTGTFSDSLIFDSIRMYSPTGTYGVNIFLAKYSSNGNVEWANSGYLPSLTCALQPDNYNFCVTTDKSNNVYLTSSFVDSIGFDSVLIHPDTNKFPSFCAFLFKFSNSGKVLWGLSSAYGGDGWSISTDNSNNIYWSGTCGHSPFKIAGLTLYDTFTTPQTFLVKLDSNGKGLCGTAPGVNSDDWIPIASDPLGENVYFSGDSPPGLTAIFGYDTISDNGHPGEYGFLAKWRSCQNIITGEEEMKNKNLSVKVYPNPNNGQFTIALQNVNEPAQVQIYNVFGEEIYQSKLNFSNTQINLGGQPTGVYLYRVLKESGAVIGSGKLIIER